MSYVDPEGHIVVGPEKGIVAMNNCDDCGMTTDELEQLDDEVVLCPECDFHFCGDCLLDHVCDDVA